MSEGCRNCYAERVAARFSGHGLPYEGLARRTASGEARWTGKGRFVNENIDQPLRWRRPRRIFVDSMSDLFYEKFSDAEIDRVFAVMMLAPHHSFQVLTKRPERMAAYLNDDALYGRLLSAAEPFRRYRADLSHIGISDPKTMPAPWIWLGVSVENQAAANERIPWLMETPAAVRFLSCEPLLGPIDLGRWVFDREAAIRQVCNGPAALTREQAEEYIADVIDWVIVGGESGHGARPMHPSWARGPRDLCLATGTPFIFKQWGDWAPYIDESKYTHCGAETERNRQTFVNRDGTTGSFWMINDGGNLSNWTTNYIEGDSHPMTRVGKKAAGNLLDGVEYTAFPRARATLEGIS